MIVIAPRLTAKQYLDPVMLDGTGHLKTMVSPVLITDVGVNETCTADVLSSMGMIFHVVVLHVYEFPTFNDDTGIVMSTFVPSVRAVNIGVHAEYVILDFAN